MLVLTRVHQEQSTAGLVAKKHSRMDKHVRERRRSQPKGKGKGKGNGKRKHPGKGNHNQDQAGSPNEETGQRTLGILSVMSKRMMVLRLPDWIEQLMCFAFRSARVLSWIRRNCQVRRREFFKVCMRVRSQRALIKTVDQSTGEVLFAVGCRDDLPIS